MIIKTCCIEHLKKALDIANERFASNLIFNRLDFIACTSNEWVKYAVTLKVKSNRSKGAKLSIRYAAPFGSGEQRIRHTSYACWHAHGAFIDALPEGSTIYTSGRTVHPGDPWQDWNIGSMMLPVMFSESCGCD